MKESLKVVQDYVKRAMDTYRPLQEIDDELMRLLEQAHKRSMSMVQSVAARKKKVKQKPSSKNGTKRCALTGRPVADCPHCQQVKKPMTLRGKGGSVVCLNVQAKNRRKNGYVVPGDILQGQHVEITPGESIRLFGKRSRSITVGDLIDVEIGGLFYTLPVTKITKKAVTVERAGGIKRIDFYDVVKNNR